MSKTKAPAKPPLSIETILPKSEQAWLELKADDVTSTEISALFNASPYDTPFSLWHRKRAREVVTIEANERMEWGQRLQDAIADGVAKDFGLTIRKMPEYSRLKGKRVGSSFDFMVLDWPEGFAVEHGLPKRPVDSGSPDFGLLEIKNVDALIFKDGWIVGEDGGIEAPPHIEFQVQHEMLVSGARFNLLAALVGGNRVEPLLRKPDVMVHAAILAKAEAFWKTVDENTPPAPDFARDTESISKLYGYASPGSVADARGNAHVTDLALRHKDASKREKDAKGDKETIRNELLTIIGDAERIEGDGFTISASMVAGGHVSFDRDPFRMCRINWPKNKKGGE